MLGKLTRYELRKMVGNKFFLIVLALLLILDVLLSCGIRQFEGRFSDISPEEMKELDQDLVAEALAMSYWDFARESRGFVPSDLARFVEMTPEERQDFEDAMREKYGEDVFGFSAMPTEEMMAVPGYFGDTWNDFTAVVNYKEWLTRNQDIEDARQSVVRSAEALGREAVMTGDDYGIRRNLRILDLYEVPRKTVACGINGWPLFLDDTAPLILACLLVFLACSGSFTSERETGVWLLLQSSRHGKGEVFLAKYLAGSITAAGLTVLFEGVAMASTRFYRGFAGGGTTVAALQDLRYCPYLWTMAQYAAVVLLCRLFGAVLLSVLLNIVSAVSKNGIISYGIGAVLLGGSLALSYFPPKLELLSGPLSLLQPQRYFASYYTANLFGFPIPWILVQLVLWSLLALGGALLAWRLYGRKRGAV